MNSLLKYHAKTYIASSKFVMPLLVYFLYLAVYYCVSPKSIVPSFSVSLCVLYILMVWVGYSYSGNDNRIAEQIAILKAGGQVKYYLSKIILLCVFGTLMSVLAVLVPLIWSAVLKIAGTALFGEQTLRFITVIIALFLHILVSALGATVGFFFHPRVIKNRKIAVMGAMLLGVLGLLKDNLIADIAGFKLIAWIFPPMSTLVGQCSGCTQLFPSLNTMLIPVLGIIVYSVIISTLNITLIKKKGF